MRMLFDCRRRTTLILLPLAAGAAILSAPPSRAQGYPDRPVQLVVAYPPGGTGDLIARPLADALGNALGQPVEVVNRAGSSGVEGARSVAQAAPDGYTLLLGQTAEIAVAPLLGRVGYDPQRDLQPIALVARIPVVLVTQATAQYSSVDELLQASRTSQRGLLFASAGPGTSGHLAGELSGCAAGVGSSTCRPKALGPPWVSCSKAGWISSSPRCPWRYPRCGRAG
jgi:tripartite-type tricarboxylate transporter receptor subunit TctC